MDQQQPPEQGVDTLSGSKTEWVRPRIERFLAGGAEAGGDTSTDGIDILS
ncbi:MAG: hypothetical protein ABWX67_16520 [Allosphingosinicella sp.]